MSLSNEQIMKLIELCPAFIDKIKSNGSVIMLDVTMDEVLEEMAKVWKSNLKSKEEISKTIVEESAKTEEKYALLYEIGGIYGRVSHAFVIPKSKYINNKYYYVGQKRFTEGLNNSVYNTHISVYKVDDDNNNPLIESFTNEFLPIWLSEEQYYKMCQLEKMKDVFTTTEQPLAKEKKETEVKEETKETIKEDKEIYASYNINGIYGNVQYSFKLEKDDFVNQNYKKCILNDIYDSLKYQFEVEIKNNNGKTLDYIEEKGLPYFLSKDEYFKMAQLQGYKGTVYLGHNK